MFSQMNASCHVAIVSAGQIFDETLSIGCSSYHMAMRAAKARCARISSILVRWEGDAHLPVARRSGLLFDVVRVLQRPPCEHKDSMLACNVRSMLRSVSVGCAEARRLGAEFVFRLRTDMLVQIWQLPTILDDSCVYAHRNKKWGVSDNVLWATTSSMAKLFAESPTVDVPLTYDHPESIIGGRISSHGLRACWIPYSIFIAKPDGSAANARQPDACKGLRRWWDIRGGGNATSYVESHLATDLPAKLLAHPSQRTACGLAAHEPPISRVQSTVRASRPSSVMMKGSMAIKVYDYGVRSGCRYQR